ncbi:hypothetical protein D3C80_2032920 [compost metagenome]
MPYNVEWRSADNQGHTMINVLNYGNETVQAAVYAGGTQAVRFTNLITGEVQEEPVLTLEPLTPYLFHIDRVEVCQSCGGGISNPASKR